MNCLLGRRTHHPICGFFLAALVANPISMAKETMSESELPDNRRVTGSLFDAISGGKFDLVMRSRHEHVDDPTAQRDAKASTVRVAAGYRTGEFHGFSAYGQVERITSVGREAYNDCGTNNKTRYATVVDPEGTEFNQAYLRYTGLPNTQLTFGRQQITHRKAPFHRHVGTVLWRQNWQSYDGFRATNTSLPHTKVNYSYIYNVNRIFGEDNPIPNRANFDINGHLINVQYDQFSYAKLEAYAYLLDFDDATRFSTQTYGIRLRGDYELQYGLKLLYAGEFALQTDFTNNANDIDVSYHLVEGGLKFKPAAIGLGFIDTIMAKASYEKLGGDGGLASFQTPLGTNHAYQGWADKFLVTPGDGIEATYFTFSAAGMGAKFVAVYHMLSSDNDSYDYGDEIDLLISKSFLKRYTVGLKYSNYDADKNALNILRNASQSNDISKFWAFFQVTI